MTSAPAQTWSPGVVDPLRLRPSTLRLSVTERCNFGCPYCTPPVGYPKTPYHDLPSLEKLATTALWLSSVLQITKVRITGGEPLVRPGLCGLIDRLNRENNLAEMTLTTNGSLLSDLTAPLKRAGLGRVNVSLDTLDPARFKMLTGGALKNTLRGIESAIEVGLTPLKINAVLQKDGWREDVPKLIAFAGERGLEVRFIELFPVGAAGAWAKDQFVPARQVRDFLSESGRLSFLPHEPGVPARPTIYRVGRQEVRIGWITPQSESFCEGCNRLRLDSRGKLRRCLMDPLALNILDILTRQGEEAAVSALSAYLLGKSAPESMISGILMTAVGG